VDETEDCTAERQAEETPPAPVVPVVPVERALRREIGRLEQRVDMPAADEQGQEEAHHAPQLPLHNPTLVEPQRQQGLPPVPEGACFYSEEGAEVQVAASG